MTHTFSTMCIALTDPVFESEQKPARKTSEPACAECCSNEVSQLFLERASVSVVTENLSREELLDLWVVWKQFENSVKTAFKVMAFKVNFDLILAVVLLTLSGKTWDWFSVILSIYWCSFGFFARFSSSYEFYGSAYDVFYATLFEKLLIFSD